VEVEKKPVGYIIEHIREEELNVRSDDTDLVVSIRGAMCKVVDMFDSITGFHRKAGVEAVANVLIQALEQQGESGTDRMSILANIEDIEDPEYSSRDLSVWRAGIRRAFLSVNQMLGVTNPSEPMSDTDCTALMRACVESDTEAITALQDSCVIPHECICDAIRLAASAGNIDVIRELLVDKLSAEEMSRALMVAINNGQDITVVYLLGLHVVGDIDYEALFNEAIGTQNYMIASSIKELGVLDEDLRAYPPWRNDRMPGVHDGPVYTYLSGEVVLVSANELDKGAYWCKQTHIASPEQVEEHNKKLKEQQEGS